jgi:hypothetical protein
MRFSGMPQRPKPPTSSLAPFGTSWIRGDINNEQANAGSGFGSDSNADPKLRYGTVKAKQGTGTT